jgi:hypothetical protein
VRLDSFFESAGRFPEVVKIDVEGAEAQVLQGMTGLFRRGLPAVVLVEVHGFYFGDEAGGLNQMVQSLLEGAGYTLQSLQGGSWRHCGPAATWPSRLHVLAQR